MREVVEVKTKAAAEKAIAAGKIVKIVAGTFSLSVSVNATIIVTGDAQPHVEARESSQPHVVARESSQPHVVARESSQPHVEAWGSSQPHVEARESSQPHVVAWGSSQPHVVARESSQPHVVALDSSQPHVVALDSSQPHVVALDSSQPHVEAWGSSQPHVVALDSSQPHVVARESSQPHVEARESSQPRVVAWGFSMLQLKGSGIKATASANVSLNLWNGATAEGGRQQVVELKTPQDWCDYHGVRVEEGCAIVYKAVGAGYRSDWGAIYTPGTMPSDPKWDGKKRECSAGGGLNFSPTPRHTHRFVSNPTHYLEARIRLDDEFAVHFNGQYPEKVCHRTVAAPLVEVDIDGNPIAAPVVEPAQ